MSRLEEGTGYPPGVEDYGYTHSSVAFAEAEETGGVVVLPKSNEIFVDLDTEDSARIFHEQIGCLSVFIGITHTEIYLSRSGFPHRHAIVTVDRDLDFVARIGLATTLGNDRRCALLQFRRYFAGDPHPILFIENRKQILLPPSSLEIVNAGQRLSTQG